jgi:tripartite-type tricarboxylate transporter receptor subunit TctC
MYSIRRRYFLGVAVAMMAGLIANPSGAQAQAWPSKEITIILAVAPGSSADSMARVVGKVMTRELKVPIQIKNVLGGAGLTGFSELAASKPDGYTIGVVNVGGLLVFPHIMKVPYTWDSFALLGTVAEAYYGLGVATNSLFKTVDDLVAAGKTRRITYSASAIMNGIALVQLGNATGAKFQFVASNTQAEAVAQAVGGHVDVVVQTPPDLVPLIEGKQLRLLAGASSSRWPNYPDVKTLKDLGYDAATVVPLGFATQSAVPKDIQTRLEQVIAIAAKDLEVLDVLKNLMIQPLALSGKQFGDALKAQAPTVEAALVAANMKKN